MMQSAELSASTVRTNKENETLQFSVSHNFRSTLWTYRHCIFIARSNCNVVSIYAKKCSIGLNGKFCVFQMKSQSFFLNIFTIFNQLYNFHCLLLPSPNVSQAFQLRTCKNLLVAYAYAISSKTQKLSVQPNTSKPSNRILLIYYYGYTP
jgi:hypothetical protein